MTACVWVCRSPRLTTELAIDFARTCGTDPDEIADPHLASLIERHAVTGPMFRLIGPDALSDAADRLRSEAATFGVA